MPESIVIVGGGAAGNAAAEMLRREGYAGRLTMLSADESVPYDRPNLSKNYLAGSAPEDWIPLRSPEFYKEQNIDLKLGARVAAIDTASRQVQLADGSRHAYDALLLATGAEPVRLELPGGDLPHVHYLRTLADSRALVARALVSKRAVVIGASFIGLEVAASLRARNIDVHVVGRETCPMEKILGAEVGNFIRKLHEEHGVTFHLGTTACRDRRAQRHLAERRKHPGRSGRHRHRRTAGDRTGRTGRPRRRSRRHASTSTWRRAFRASSRPATLRAGRIRLTGERIRVEHWVVAERQGQTAARNILGRRERFDAVPFFWTEQYDFGLAYVGHAERFDKAEIDGQLDARDCTITYRRGGRKLAVAVIHRDLEGLRAEVEFEQTIAQRVNESAAAGEPAGRALLGV